MNAAIDTGGEISLFPNTHLPDLDFRQTERGLIRIEQAGIAKQSFDAIEGQIVIILEDPFGNQTNEFEITTWFGDTNRTLLGFEGILDRAVLHLDMLYRLEGWIEMDV